MTDRDPFDGKPYYCETCGLGLAEYYACEEVDCELESPETAQCRMQWQQRREQSK